MNDQVNKNAPKFRGSFTQQEPLPTAAIEAAIAIMQSGRLHRYNLVPGEIGATQQLEQAFADWQDRRYCLAVASGGQAMQLALRAFGLAPGEPVLTNAFTLAPVPGAIHAVGGKPVFVESDTSLRMDLDDLQAKAHASGARVVMISHMRGHLCDSAKLQHLCQQLNLTLIEDCAHTMGASWAGLKSGNLGLAGCFSTQTYKHMNSGEGGLLVSDDPKFMARAIIGSGSYMLYARHGACPPEEAFTDAKLDMPNCSARMDHLRAAILLPQLALLDDNIERWNQRYRRVEQGLGNHAFIRTIQRPEPETFVGSSIQFRIPNFTVTQCQAMVSACADRGVEIKWFGADQPQGFTSKHSSWRYVTPQTLPHSDAILATLFDMRLPLTFSLEDCDLIAHILADVAQSIGHAT